MRYARSRARSTTLNMTPLIDVVLVLIVFFLMTTTFVLAPGMKVDLPPGSAMQRVSDSDTTVVITQDGTVYYQNAGVDLQALQMALRQAQHQHPGLRLVIQADKSAQHGRVVEVMDLAKSLGIERLAIATAPKQAPPP
jgi:biopolymer transport protein ExbD